MSNPQLIKTNHLLEQARELRSQIQQNIKEHNFPDDDLHMKTYNDLITAAAELFLYDPILNGQMVKMPDAIVQAYDPKYDGLFPLGHMSPELPSHRTKQHLTRLINRLELLLGEKSDQQPLDERNFSFMSDQKLRQVLKADFIEAQKSLKVGGHKACGLLSGGLIEGMLLDILQRPDIEQKLNKIVKKLKIPMNGLNIDWDKVSMTNLIQMSRELDLIRSATPKFTEAARDVRNTVHPRAEVRQGRVSKDEAEILLQLVKLIYNDLNVKQQKTQND